MLIFDDFSKIFDFWPNLGFSEAHLWVNETRYFNSQDLDIFFYFLNLFLSIPDAWVHENCFGRHTSKPNERWCRILLETKQHFSPPVTVFFFRQKIFFRIFWKIFHNFFSMKLTVKNFRIFFTMKSAVKNFSIA